MEEISKLLLEEKKNIELELRSRYEESSEIGRDVGDEVDFSVVEQERDEALAHGSDFDLTE